MQNKAGRPYDVGVDPQAIGGAWETALGAMYAGASAEEAARLCIERHAAAGVRRSSSASGREGETTMTTMVKRCEAMMVPLRDWTEGWLKMEVATLSHHPEYPLMHDQEKRSKELPVTREEMIAYITAKTEERS